MTKTRQILLFIFLPLVLGSLAWSCGPAAPQKEKGCEETSLYVRPTDPSKPGPWAVGTRTIQLAGFKTEVLYPSLFGSENGKEKAKFDIREHLPEKEQKKIPDDKSPLQPCNCYRDLSVDSENGPYPVVLFIHGTAGFRTQSLAHLVHWASRGFVVLTADHPGIFLGDVLQLKFTPQQDEDAKKLLAALHGSADAIPFLKGKMDLKRIAIAGHSAGGNALQELGKEKGVQVLIPMAAGGITSEFAPTSTLVLGGMEDTVVPYKRQQDGYKLSGATKRLVGLKKAGHHAFSEICTIGKEEGGILKIAQKYKVTIPAGFQGMIDKLANDGCEEGKLDIQKGWDIVHFASSAVLEETLQCSQSAGKQLENMQKQFPEIGEYQVELKK